MLQGDLVFGWRLDLKHRLVAGRLALLCGDPGGRARRRRAGVAGGRAGGPPLPQRRPAAPAPGGPGPGQAGGPGGVAADLDLLDASVAIEAWRRTGEVAADFANPVWLDRAADRAARLARHAGRLRRRAPAARGPAPGWRPRLELSHRGPGRARARPASGLGSAGRDDQHGDDQRPGTGRGPLGRRRAAARAPGPATRRNGAKCAMPSRQDASCAGVDRPVGDGDRCAAARGEAGGGRLVGEPRRIRAAGSASRLSSRTRRGAVAERASASSTASLAGCVQPGANALAARPRPTRRISRQARAGSAQVVEAERGHDEVEAAVAERQRRPRRPRPGAARGRPRRSMPRPGRPPPPARAPRPARPARPRPVPAPRSSTRPPASGTGAAPTSARASARVHRLRAVGPLRGRRVVGGPHLGALSRACSAAAQLAAQRQQLGRSAEPRPAPPSPPTTQLLVVAAERLLPAELDQGAEQAQRQLAVPPRLGVDAGVLQRGPVGRDRVLLGLRQAAAVDRQVPGQVAERRADARAAPSRAARSGPRRRCRGCPASSCCARTSAGSLASASTSGPGSSASGVTTAAAAGATSASSGQPLADQLRHQVRASPRPPRPAPSRGTARGSGAWPGRRRTRCRSPRTPRAARPCAAGSAGAGRAGSARRWPGPATAPRRA